MLTHHPIELHAYFLKFLVIKNFFNADGIAAAAGFTSNVLDIAKFARWQMKLLASIEKNILLSTLTKQLAFSLLKKNGLRKIKYLLVIMATHFQI